MMLKKRRADQTGRRLTRKGKTAAIIVAAFSLLLINMGSISASAKRPTGTAGTAGAASGVTAGSTAGVPSALYAATLNGGYTAAGTGLRNRGFGTIAITGVPSGAAIVKAYLIWSVLGASPAAANYNDGVFAGTAIAGVGAGSGAEPCWNGSTGVTTGYTYHADVTAKVTGNGNYALSGFASGTTNGSDPWNLTGVAPLAEGASLVVVYSKASYPATRVLISDGYAMTSSAVLTTTMTWGFPASNIVGQVYTTYIGGDGQGGSGTEPPSKFNNKNVGAADWDGTDPPSPAYSLGNLWDTDTANVGKFVLPGQTSASVKVTGGPDCLIWAGQVVSIGVDGNVDTDGDKLRDGWEANGYDANGDGIVDVALPGASTVHKDLYVEMDYMGAEAVCPCHLPLAPDLDRIVKAYAQGPGSVNNPDGKPGIHVHLDAGAARGSKYNLGGGNLVPFDADLNPVAAQFNAIKAGNFNPQRAKIYYYMIWAHGYDGGSSSGNAFAIPNDSFVVTLGLWGGGGSSDAKVGTFIHEFGHDLGLFHGGNDSVNYKPNYLSVMNYQFQIGGLPRVGAAPNQYGYQRFGLPSLNENNLDENVGLNSASAATYKTTYYCGLGGALTTTPGTANGPIDWSCGGLIQAGTVADINNDGGLSTLTSRNDWATLVYGGGAVGFPGLSNGAAASVAAPSTELTYEESLG